MRGNDQYGLADNQRLAHEFEHGRQVLDSELSFRDTDKGWVPFAHDLIDEAKGFQAGFDIEGVSPGQGEIPNGIARALAGGPSDAAQYLNDHISYKGLAPFMLNVPSPPPPNVYSVPK